MAIGIDEFNQGFFQEILSGADADGQFVEDIFFERFCEYLTDAGEMDVADRAYYRHPTAGIRVDGYGGDPILNGGTLNLIIADFNQSMDVSRLVKTEMDAIFQRLLKFLQKTLDTKWRNQLEETRRGFGLADLITQRWARTFKVRMFLISNRELSSRVDGRDAGELDGRPITYSVWDLKRLHRFATVGHGREEIAVELEKDFGGGIPLLPAHLSSDDYESYLAVVPGEMLAKIYDRWGARLLEQNVRVFLQARGNVNKGIRNTLTNDPTMFFAYNNGITVTAEAIETTNNKNSQLLLTNVQNLQIVNGGQTTASIHVAYRNKVDLSRVFVQMKLSIVSSERSEEVVPKISEYANSQNRVNAADFFANHPFHVRMEEFSRRLFAPSTDGTFRETKWFYERARGQYADARSLLTPAQRKQFDLENPRPQLLSKTDLAKYINVWHGYPDWVCKGAQKNFAHFAHRIGQIWKKDSDSLGEAYFRECIAKAMVFKAAEKTVSAQDWYPGSIRAQIVAYTIAKIGHAVEEKKMSIDFGDIWQRQSVGDGLAQALVQISKQVFDQLEDRPENSGSLSEWAKKQACWAQVKNINLLLPGNFLDELVTEEDQKSLMKAARKDQKVLNGIEAEIFAFNAGGAFWIKLLDWGQNKKVLSQKQTEILRIACQIPVKSPTERQALILMEIYSLLKSEGCNYEVE